MRVRVRVRWRVPGARGATVDVTATAEGVEVKVEATGVVAIVAMVAEALAVTEALAVAEALAVVEALAVAEVLVAVIALDATTGALTRWSRRRLAEELLALSAREMPPGARLMVAGLTLG